MNAAEKDILQSLTELDQAVKSLATANPKPDLKPLLSRVDELTR
jgi:hypothetical protein